MKRIIQTNADNVIGTEIIDDITVLNFANGKELQVQVFK